jgi:hypothetical protein
MDAIEDRDWCELLSSLHGAGWIELRPKALQAAPGGRLHALARFEAQNRSHLTTPLHTPVHLDPSTRLVVQALAEGDDGSTLRDLSTRGTAEQQDEIAAALIRVRSWGLTRDPRATP